MNWLSYWETSQRKVNVPERENLEEEELTVFDMLLKDKKISDKEKGSGQRSCQGVTKKVKKERI